MWMPRGFGLASGLDRGQWAQRESPIGREESSQPAPVVKPLDASEATAYMPMCRLVRWRSCRPSPAGIGRLHAKTFASDSWLPLLLIALSNQMSPSNTPAHTVSESVHNVRIRSLTLGHAVSSQYWQKIQFQVSTGGCLGARKWYQN